MKVLIGEKDKVELQIEVGDLFIMGDDKKILIVYNIVDEDYPYSLLDVETCEIIDSYKELREIEACEEIKEVIKKNDLQLTILK